MKYLFSVAAAAIALSACNGAPPNEEILTQSCTNLFQNDSRAMELITEGAETDLATYCGCYAAKTVADGTRIDQHKEILAMMVEIRSADGLSVQKAADRMEERFDSGEITSVSKQDFEDLGEYFDGLSDDMRDAGGTCPA